MDERAKRVIDAHILCNKLKYVVRTGWKDWKVKRERLESIAEHIYGTQMLAIFMYSEFQYDLDIKKVVLMLALHELEETIIGDLTHFQITKEEKEIIGHEAVEKICANLSKGSKIRDLLFEFDDCLTKEAQFAFMCDKLEFDLQSKIYSDEGCVDVFDQDDNPTSKDKKVQQLLKERPEFGYMILKYGQQRYNYDDNFRSVSDYALTHRLNIKKD